MKANYLESRRGCQFSFWSKNRDFLNLVWMWSGGVRTWALVPGEINFELISSTKPPYLFGTFINFNLFPPILFFLFDISFFQLPLVSRAERTAFTAAAEGVRRAAKGTLHPSCTIELGSSGAHFRWLYAWHRCHE